MFSDNAPYWPYMQVNIRNTVQNANPWNHAAAWSLGQVARTEPKFLIISLRMDFVLDLQYLEDFHISFWVSVNWCKCMTDDVFVCISFRSRH